MCSTGSFPDLSTRLFCVCKRASWTTLWKETLELCLGWDSLPALEVSPAFITSNWAASTNPSSSLFTCNISFLFPPSLIYVSVHIKKSFFLYWALKLFSCNTLLFKKSHSSHVWAQLWPNNPVFFINLYVAFGAGISNMTSRSFQDLSGSWTPSALTNW